MKWMAWHGMELRLIWKVERTKFRSTHTVDANLHKQSERVREREKHSQMNRNKAICIENIVWIGGHATFSRFLFLLFVCPSHIPQNLMFHIHLFVSKKNLRFNHAEMCKQIDHWVYAMHVCKTSWNVSLHMVFHSWFRFIYIQRKSRNCCNIKRLQEVPLVEWTLNRLISWKGEKQSENGLQCMCAK